MIFFRYRLYTNVYIAVPLVYIAVLLYPFYFRLCLFKHVPGYLPVYFAQIGTLLLLLTKIMITRYSVNECQCLIKRNSAIPDTVAFSFCRKAIRKINLAR